MGGDEGCLWGSLSLSPSLPLSFSLSLCLFPLSVSCIWRLSVLLCQHHTASLVPSHSWTLSVSFSGFSLLGWPPWRDVSERQGYWEKPLGKRGQGLKVSCAQGQAMTECSVLERRPWSGAKVADHET
jgi:hypothetical protein